MADYPSVYQSGLLPRMRGRGSKPTAVVITGVPQPLGQLTFGSFSPATGVTITTTDALHFTVTGVRDARLGLALGVLFAGSMTPEFVYDGTAFTPMYAAGSSCVVNDNTAAVTLVRAGGWPAAPTLTAFTIYNG